LQYFIRETTEKGKGLEKIERIRRREGSIGRILWMNSMIFQKMEEAEQ
jgi:hypothetical protein